MSFFVHVISCLVIMHSDQGHILHCTCSRTETVIIVTVYRSQLSSDELFSCVHGLHLMDTGLIGACLHTVDANYVAQVERGSTTNQERGRLSPGRFGRRSNGVSLLLLQERLLHHLRRQPAHGLSRRFLYITNTSDYIYAHHRESIRVLLFPEHITIV